MIRLWLFLATSMSIVASGHCDWIPKGVSRRSSICGDRQWVSHGTQSLATHKPLGLTVLAGCTNKQYDGKPLNFTVFDASGHSTQSVNAKDVFYFDYMSRVALGDVREGALTVRVDAPLGESAGSDLIGELAFDCGGGIEVRHNNTYILESAAVAPMNHRYILALDSANMFSVTLYFSGPISVNIADKSGGFRRQFKLEYSGQTDFSFEQEGPTYDLSAGMYNVDIVASDSDKFCTVKFVIRDRPDPSSFCPPKLPVGLLSDHRGLATGCPDTCPGAWCALKCGGAPLSIPPYFRCSDR
eukprot:456414_1